MTPVNVVVYQTMRVATVRGQESHQITPATDRDHHRSHPSCTIVKYVKLAVLGPRYNAHANELNSFVSLHCLLNVMQF